MSVAVAMVYGRSGAVRAVFCDPAGDPPGQSWFTVVLADAGPPEDGPDEAPVQVACLLEDFGAELGAGLDLALVHGCVERDRETGEWRPTSDGDFHFEQL